MMRPDSQPPVYDSIGDGYRNYRVPDKRIAAQIHAALGNARTICNIGAGAGSYEPLDRVVTAVEPSQKMIAQRESSHPVVCATAECLPFDDNAFDASMAILTIHHWSDVVAGLQEMKRVSRRQVIFTFDLDKVDSFWLVQDYLPEIIELEHRRAATIESITNILEGATVSPVEIPFDCTDGFQCAYWRRPHEYLDAGVRAAISTLSLLPHKVIEPAMRRLKDDLESGAWKRRYGDLLEQESLDFGYRLIVSGTFT